MNRNTKVKANFPYHCQGRPWPVFTSKPGGTIRQKKRLFQETLKKFKKIKLVSSTLGTVSVKRVYSLTRFVHLTYTSSGRFTIKH